MPTLAEILKGYKEMTKPKDTNSGSTPQNKAYIVNAPTNYGNQTPASPKNARPQGNQFFKQGTQTPSNQGNSYSNITQFWQQYQSGKVSPEGSYGKMATNALGGTSQASTPPTTQDRPKTIKDFVTLPMSAKGFDSTWGYKPYAETQGGQLIVNANKNLSQASRAQQATAGALPSWARQYQSLTGYNLSGGFQGSLKTKDNPEVLAVANPYTVDKTPQPVTTGAGMATTIDQNQNQYSTDLPMTREDFSAAAMDVQFRVADYIEANVPPTDPRWNMKQGLYQKAMMAADPMMEIQANPQLAPSQRYMQQLNDNIVQLPEYDAFGTKPVTTPANSFGTTLDKIKQSPYLPLILFGAGAILLFSIIFRKKSGGGQGAPIIVS
jgi:hypothetical protein